MKRPPRGELVRKVGHLGAGGFAFALRELGPGWAAVAALAGGLFNLLLLPRLGGRVLWRAGEAERGIAVGIVAYPVVVLLLIVSFHSRLEVAAATWGILAFGDGSAGLVGGLFGGRKLPWNAEKSWAGSTAYWVAGTLAAGSLLVWTAPGRFTPLFAFGVAALAALASALLESAPEGLDDNLLVPLVTGLLLYCLLLVRDAPSAFPPPGFWSLALGGLLLNALLASVAHALATVDWSGAVSGCLLGTVLFAFAGWRGYLVLVVFFAIGSGATRLGFRRKAAAGIAEGNRGRRGAGSAVAKTSVAAAGAVFAALTPLRGAFLLAAVAALATGAADTAASEIGKLWGRPTVLVTTLRPVPPGTEGAISLVGTLAGLAAAVAVAVVGAVVGLEPFSVAPLVVVAAFVATTLESVVGATLERRGWLGNDAVNFLNTLTGALLAVGLASLGRTG